MIDYKSEAQSRAQSPEGTLIHCAYDKIVELKALKPNPKNPNMHNDKQIKLLADIIKSTGWRAPITVSSLSGYIVKGHGRRLAAIHAGLRHVPVEYQNYTSEVEEQADLIADNRIAELASIDEEKLVDMLRDMEGIPIDLTGFNTDEVMKMLADDLETEQESDENESQESEEPMSKLGDLWLLGDHRLLCGSATNPKDVELLMDGRKAQMVHTDPPYGVSYEDSHGNSIMNDSLTDDDLANKLLIPAFKNYVKYTEDTAAFYIWHASSQKYAFDEAMKAAGLLEKEQIIWVKDNFVMGRADYHWQHEPCYYAEKQGYTAKFYGDRSNATCWKITQNTATEATVDITGGVLLTNGKDKMYVVDRPPKGKKLRTVRINDDKVIYMQRNSPNSTVWEINRETNPIHPTQKPVEIPIRAIINSSREGDIVLDFFGGSGSTLIACQITGRICYSTELDPKYCDAIIKRFIEKDGIDNIKCQRDGKVLTLGEIMAGVEENEKHKN